MLITEMHINAPHSLHRTILPLNCVIHEVTLTAFCIQQLLPPCWRHNTLQQRNVANSCMLANCCVCGIIHLSKSTVCK